MTPQHQDTMFSANVSRKRLYAILVSLQVMTYGSVVLAEIPLQKEGALERREAAALKELAAQKPSESKPAAPAAAAADQVKLLVQKITFSGHSVFTTAELEALVAADLGREMTLAELQQLAAKVSDHYHARGYFLAYVVIPEQNFAEQAGTVQFLVLEGRLGEITVQGSNRYSEERVRQKLSSVKPGEPIKKEELERSLLVLKRTSGIKECSSLLKAGSAVGSTDVAVAVAEEDRVTGSLEFNNFGSKTTGEYRVIPRLSLPNLSGLGDGLDLELIASPDINEMYYGQANYMLPLGDSGARLNTYVNNGNYEVGEEYAELDIQGESTGGGIGVSYPYILTPQTTLTLEGWLEAADYQQTMLGEKISEDQIRKIRLGLNLDRQDASGRTFFGLALHQGLGEFLGGMANDSEFASRLGASNEFTKVSAELVRLQRLTEQLFLIGRVSAQASLDSLVSGEQLSIGGADSVRGHPQSAYLGDQGLLLSLEARYSLLPGTDRYQLACFIDHGQIFIKEAGVGQDDSQEITGVGVGARVNLFDKLPIRLDIGVPVGDKTDDDVYVYLQTSYNF